MYRATESPSNSFTPVVDQQTTPWHGSYPTRDGKIFYNLYLTVKLI